MEIGTNKRRWEIFFYWGIGFGYGKIDGDSILIVLPFCILLGE